MKRGADSGQPSGVLMRSSKARCLTPQSNQSSLKPVKMRNARPMLTGVVPIEASPKAEADGPDERQIRRRPSMARDVGGQIFPRWNRMASWLREAERYLVAA